MFGSFLALLGIGVLAIVIAIVGYRRGKLVAIFRARRDYETGLFWYGFLFQLGLGIMCIVGAIVALFRLTE